MLAGLALLNARADAAANWNPDQPGAQLEIALLTVGPGDIYWQRFGHNAIWVRDRESGQERLYNYGIFDFAEKNFLLNFARGRLQYSMVGRPAAHDIGDYVAEGRRVNAQALNLSPPQRLALRDFLLWNAQPENTRYTYDYFLSNCSTKVRDALDQVLGGALKAATDGRSRGSTFRTHARRLTAPDLPVYLGIHAGLGPATDQPIDFWDEMFIPMEVEKHLREVQVRDDTGAIVPLVANEMLIAGGQILEPSAPPQWRGWFAIAGASAAVLMIWLGAGTTWRRRTLGVLAGTVWLLAGLAGIVLGFLWLGTDHQAAWRNWNIALFNPLALLLLPTAWRLIRNRPMATALARYTAAMLCALAILAWGWLVLPGAGQDIVDWVALMLPIHLATWWVLRGLRA